MPEGLWDICNSFLAKQLEIYSLKKKQKTQPWHKLMAYDMQKDAVLSRCGNGIRQNMME